MAAPCENFQTPRDSIPAHRDFFRRELVLVLRLLHCRASFLLGARCARVRRNRGRDSRAGAAFSPLLPHGGSKFRTGGSNVLRDDKWHAARDYLLWRYANGWVATKNRRGRPI